MEFQEFDYVKVQGFICRVVAIDDDSSILVHFIHNNDGAEALYKKVQFHHHITWTPGLGYEYDSSYMKAIETYCKKFKLNLRNEYFVWVELDFCEECDEIFLKEQEIKKEIGI